MYTGRIDAGKEVQVQNIAFPKNPADPFLREWVKPAYNPVIRLPIDVPGDKFRDPTTAWVLQRGAPPPTATSATAPPHHPASSPRTASASPVSPRFPPGFPSPLLSLPDLVAGLFPQLVGIRPDPRPVPAVADASGLVRQVSFAVNAAVLEGTPPPPIQGAPRPCLKSCSFMEPGQSLLRVRISPSSPARPAAASWRSDGSSGNPEDEWRLVRPAYWWRAERSTHQPSRRPSGSSYSPPQRQQQFVKLRDRECHRCLLKGHCQSGCRNPLTCRRCRRVGHKARGCSDPPFPFVSSSQEVLAVVPPCAAVVSAPLQHLPPPPVLSQPPLAGPMSRQAPRPLRIGDPSLRPEEGHVVIIATPEMEANAASLESLGAFLWLDGNRPTANAAEIKEAINNQFGIDRVTMVPHYPEDFFTLFEYPHHRDRVTASPGRFRHAGLDIHSSNWRRDAHFDIVQANYHVHLCIESIPLNA
ncbi:uncharacterized protein LOC125540296 [Triticum urartu]|uniref:uncharacterized protein LOC125540296 n=1 Tax=Triticum urartu TaxID=4572 RepID=UPI002044114E|nr:uncharacterized protein LOC125540296 [Triticum urartu]XP_048559859.1 uncharacterized protein LOC125540296 [Triticum urartu]